MLRNEAFRVGNMKRKNLVNKSDKMCKEIKPFVKTLFRISCNSKASTSKSSPPYSLNFTSASDLKATFGALLTGASLWWLKIVSI